MVKNFMYGIYETFEVGISPMENLKFTYHDEQFSLEELVAEVLNNKLSKEEMQTCYSSQPPQNLLLFLYYYKKM